MFGIALDQSWLQWAAAKGSGRKVPAGSLHDNAVAHAVASWACPKTVSLLREWSVEEVASKLTPAEIADEQTCWDFPTRSRHEHLPVVRGDGVRTGCYLAKPFLAGTVLRLPIAP